MKAHVSQVHVDGESLMWTLHCDESGRFVSFHRNRSQADGSPLENMLGGMADMLLSLSELEFFDLTGIAPSMPDAIPVTVHPCRVCDRTVSQDEPGRVHIAGTSPASDRWYHGTCLPVAT